MSNQPATGNQHNTQGSPDPIDTGSNPRVLPGEVNVTAPGVGGYFHDGDTHPLEGAPANVWLCVPTGPLTPHPDGGSTDPDDDGGIQQRPCDRDGDPHVWRGERPGGGDGGGCGGGWDGEDEEPPGPIWARRTVEAFSRPGERVIIRAAGSYLGVAGEAVALIGAALATGRRPMAMLPTPAIAARTRALLPTVLPTQTPRPATAAGPAAPPGRLGRQLERASRVWVGVGRRRPGMEAAPAGLVVVLAGPVAPGARPVRRRITPGLLGSWARPLRPGGVLVIARPPELGARAARRAQPHAALVSAAQDAGLVYLAHIVLVHAPTTANGLDHPSITRRPHAPFWPAHSDLLAFASPDAPDPTDPEPMPAPLPTVPARPPHTASQNTPPPAPPPPWSPVVARSAAVPETGHTRDTKAAHRAAPPGVAVSSALGSASATEPIPVPAQPAGDGPFIAPVPASPRRRAVRTRYPARAEPDPPRPRPVGSARGQAATSTHPTPQPGHGVSTRGAQR